jgi:multidrug efflux pump subunit AcrA (membrane-fusion protein)
MSTETVSPARQKPRSNVRIAAVVLIVVALIAVAAVAMRGRKPGNANPAVAGAPSRPADTAPAAPEVRVEMVSAASLDQPIRVTGTLRTDETVTVSTKATGQVKLVSVREGDRVRRGQLLVVLDDSDIRAQRDRAVAALRSSQAKLAQAVTNRKIKNQGVQSDYRRAQQALAQAQSRLSQAKTLATITDTEAESRVTSARSNLQSARERLKSLQEGSRRQEKLVAESAVNRAQAQVNRAKDAMERREQLLKEGAIAREVVDNARRDYEVALADLNSAKEQLSLVQEGPRGEEIRVGEESVRQAEAALRDAEANRSRREVSKEEIITAETQVRQAEAALDAARASLAEADVNADEIRNAQAAVNLARADIRFQDELIKQTRVFSPVNGVVTKRSVQEGAAVVAMRNELMTLVSLDTLYFEATAPETSLSYLTVGQGAQVVLDALPGKILPGTLREIIPVAEGTNRSVRLRISFPKPGSGAVVGGFARAMIRASSAGISIPRTAVVPNEGELGVFVLNGTQVAHRPVRIGEAGGVGDRVPVQEGLRVGDQIVVEGASSLKDGQTVQIK